jgi:hypothetical protein
MANRRFEQFKYSLIKKQTEIEGVISLAADASIVSFDMPGVATVAKSSTGAYTVTLQDQYNACMGIYTQVAETAQNLEAKPGAQDVSVAKTVVVNTKVNGTNTDATATCKIYVKIVLRNSSVE